jgi:hypothetical protein
MARSQDNAFQETAARLSSKLQELYDSSDPNEKEILERILVSAERNDTSQLAEPTKAAAGKDNAVLVKTPVRVTIAKKRIDFPVLVLHW